ncbi:MAG: DUF86 domain-containing protein [Maricaulaceae bacterium]|nr:DUF86 domain-containing protein [Maricaulaceae bacterium]
MREAFERLAVLRMARTLDDLTRDPDLMAAVERYLEIISEGSRHIPESLKAQRPDIPWRRVADIGNRLRHAYHAIDVETLWTIITDDLDTLRAAIESILEREA